MSTKKRLHFSDQAHQALNDCSFMFKSPPQIPSIYSGVKGPKTRIRCGKLLTDQYKKLKLETVSIATNAPEDDTTIAPLDPETSGQEKLKDKNKLSDGSMTRALNEDSKPAYAKSFTSSSAAASEHSLERQVEKLYNLIDSICSANAPDKAKHSYTEFEKLLRQIQDEETARNQQETQVEFVLEGNTEQMCEESNKRPNCDYLIQMAKRGGRNGVTLLHTAIRNSTKRNEYAETVVNSLIVWHCCLLKQDRKNTQYEGQTPLHMAICKGDVTMVSTLLAGNSSVLHVPAKGSAFKDTVMLGELPFSTAVLKFDKRLTCHCLRNGADMRRSTDTGDTVCHALIRYAALNQDDLEHVKEMCRFITEHDRTTNKQASAQLTEPNEENKNETQTGDSRLTSIWFQRNKKGLTPLQLAATEGLYKLFSFIMGMRDVYLIKYENETRIHTKYDVTEIYSYGDDNSGILPTVFEQPARIAIEFMKLPQIARCTSSKWNAYYKAFYGAMVVYILFMCFLTWYAVTRSYQTPNAAHNTGFDVQAPAEFQSKVPHDVFVTTYAIISAVFATLCVAQDIVRMLKGRMRWTFCSFKNAYSNGLFRVLFHLFSLCLLVDVFAAIWSDMYENYCLILAVILGWFLVLFFLRAIKYFNYFSVLVQNILEGDILRFTFVLMILLTSFSSVIFMTIQGSDVIEDTEYSSFWRVLFFLFKLIFGLGSTGRLHETRLNVLAIILFVGFILMTPVLIVNALIALMEQTSVSLSKNNLRDVRTLLQRLSIIVFIESVLPSSWIHIGEDKTSSKRSYLTQSITYKVRSSHN